MQLIPNGVILSNVVSDENVEPQDFSIRFRAYSETDQWVVQGNNSWSFHLDGNTLGLTIDTVVVAEADVRANMDTHLVDFVVTANLEANPLVTFYVNGQYGHQTSVTQVQGLEFPSPWNEIVIHGDGSPQILVDRLTLDFGNVWTNEEVVGEAGDLAPGFVRHGFRGTLDEFQEFYGSELVASSNVTYSNIAGEYDTDTVAIVPSNHVLRRDFDTHYDTDTFAVRVKAADSGSWAVVGANADSDSPGELWSFKFDATKMSMSIGAGSDSVESVSVESDIVGANLNDFFVSVTETTTTFHLNGASVAVSGVIDMGTVQPWNRIEIRSNEEPLHIDLLEILLGNVLSDPFLSNLSQPTPFTTTHTHTDNLPNTLTKEFDFGAESGFVVNKDDNIGDVVLITHVYK